MKCRVNAGGGLREFDSRMGDGSSAQATFVLNNNYLTAMQNLELLYFQVIVNSLHEF